MQPNVNYCICVCVRVYSYASWSMSFRTSSMRFGTFFSCGRTNRLSSSWNSSPSGSSSSPPSSVYSTTQSTSTFLHSSGAYIWEYRYASKLHNHKMDQWSFRGVMRVVFHHFHVLFLLIFLYWCKSINNVGGQHRWLLLFWQPATR